MFYPFVWYRLLLRCLNPAIACQGMGPTLSGTLTSDPDAYVDNISHRLKHHLCMYLWLYSPCEPWPLVQFLNRIHSR
jgi:hypothetical protein